MYYNKVRSYYKSIRIDSNQSPPGHEVDMLRYLHQNPLYTLQFRESGWRVGRWVLCLLSVLISFQGAWANGNEPVQSPGSLNWAKESRVPFRRAIEECGLYLTPSKNGHVLNDGVGVKLASTKIAEFREELPRLIEEYGTDRMQGGVFYITGIKMGHEKETEAGIQSILNENGIQAKVSALSVPRTEQVAGVLDFMDRARERLAYMFPSKKRDFQKPIPAEVLNGLLVTGVIDAANVVYLFKSGMPMLDATATAMSHVTILAAYTVYSQYMLNWLLRDMSNKRLLLAKQMSLSLPFVINYTLFTQLTHLMSNNPLADLTPAQAAASFVGFVATQLPTLYIQTKFYQKVITEGFGSWAGGQQGEARSNSARAWRSWFQAPILALDAILLGWASTGTFKFLEVNQDVLGANLNANINAGHVGIAALSVLGVTWFRLAPRGLDRALDKAIQFETWVTPFIDPIKERFYRRFPGLRPPETDSASS